MPLSSYSTCALWYFSGEELPDIRPFAAFVSSLHIESEDRVLCVSVARAWIAYPYAEIHLLSGTYLGIRRYGSHQSRCVGTIGIEAIAVGSTSMLLLFGKRLINTIGYRVLSVVRERILGAASIGRCIVNGIGVAIGGFLPREVSVVVFHIGCARLVIVEVFLDEGDIVFGNLCIADEFGGGRSVGGFIHKIDDKADDEQFVRQLSIIGRPP